MNAMSNAVLDQVFEPVTQCFTPEVATRIAALRASPKLQEQIDELAEKCIEGTLTPEEQSDYEAVVRALNFVALLQAKARAALTE